MERPTPHTTNTIKPQYLGQNGQTKSYSFCKTPRIGLSTLSVPTVGNGRRNDLNAPHQMALPMKKIRIN
jgi:hypothetical protein